MSMATNTKKQYEPLTYDEKKVLSKWAGYDWCDISLLYRASRDRCSFTAFHEKCDNMGPTITIIYATTGYVFGAYTSLSWRQDVNAWTNDPKPFIFSLRAPNGKQQQKLALVPNGKVYHGPSHGPYFANTSGYACLLAIGANVDIGFGTDGVLAPSMTCNIEQAGIDRGTLTNLAFTGGATQYFDIEVYSIKESQLLPAEEEWRRLGTGFEWVPQPLKEEIKKHIVPEALKVPHTNILLLGPLGTGKSSFFNTINSAFRGHVTSQAPVGTGSHSITTKLRQYKVRVDKGDCLGLRICDAMGFEEDGGLILHDVPYILDGNIPDHFQFNPAVGITPNHQDFQGGPKLKDKVHVTAIVLDGFTVGNLSFKVVDKVNTVVSMARHRGIPCVILLTKIDKVCPHVAEDAKNVFRSKAILDLVSQVSELVGIARTHVLPVQNYEVQINTEEVIDTLALMALRQMLRFAEDFYYEQLDILGE